MQVGYRVAGLPTATRALISPSCGPAGIVRRAYARRFWHPERPAAWLELCLALVLWPVIVPAAAVWCTWKNGSIVSRREHRPIHRQLLDLLRLYVAAGVLAPWYYMFELYRRPHAAHARSFVYRWESKGGTYALLREGRPHATPMLDKVAFAEICRAHGVPTIPVLAVAREGKVEWQGTSCELEIDWFVKPIDGKGGKGIERWDYVGGDRFRRCGSDVLHRDELLRRIADASRSSPCFIQPRVENHPDLQDLSNGALATIRALTCLDESGEPELIGAVLRMATGRNQVVDNFHAGGIAAAIELDSGILGQASNLGVDARLGWLDAHPNSSARIRGRRVPCWESFRSFVEDAHGSFADRTLIGWDVAITAAGAVVVEANGSPDLDIMQRIAKCGMMTARLGQLLAHHVTAR